jgi:predicted GH43/DUF377 family glycosyl hydrolase
MITITRSEKNPILKPNSKNSWESKAAFNPSVVKDDAVYHMVYRALSDVQNIQGKNLQVSTIGYAKSNDGVIFEEQRQLIKPQEIWEKFGCEDPRITKIDNEYFIFYTALSDYPFYPSAIKVGLAIFSEAFERLEKHPVTPFNAKAMVLFPEKINGKYVALLTVNTDIPPAKIAIAWFDKKEDIWSENYWRKWYQNLGEHTLPLQRLNSDQLEAGTVPIKTEQGWLLIYAHIQHYDQEKYRLFGVEAVLLDLENPQKIIARTNGPIVYPQEEYELKGNVASVVFPSGAVVRSNIVYLYYGASDTVSCLATFSLENLFKEMTRKSSVALKVDRPLQTPLLTPVDGHIWESKAVFNPAVFYDGNYIHLLYRAMGPDNTSVFGYARTKDGLTIDKRSEIPVYVPRAVFEEKKRAGENSGCEDPRITVMGNKIYACYTAFDGINPPRIALTSIEVSDFLQNNFNWSDPVLISPPGIDDKDGALFPETVNGKYVFAHRIQNSIVLDYVDSLDFDGKTWLRSLFYITPRENFWDSEKIGISTPPIKTDKGWLLLYHGVSKLSHEYRIGAMLLDLNDPSKVLSRTPWPILEPETKYEQEGCVKNVVFPCGSALIKDKLFIYYGGADTVVAVVTISFPRLLYYLESM